METCSNVPWHDHDTRRAQHIFYFGPNQLNNITHANPFSVSLETQASSLCSHLDLSVICMVSNINGLLWHPTILFSFCHVSTAVFNHLLRSHLQSAFFPLSVVLGTEFIPSQPFPHAFIDISTAQLTADVNLNPSFADHYVT